MSLRIASAWAPFLLAHWVNLSMAVLCPALVLLRWHIQASGAARPAAPAELTHSRLERRLCRICVGLVTPDVGRALVLLAIATATGLALKHFAASDRTRLSFTPPQEWPTAWFRLAESIWHTLTSREWLVFHLTTPLAAVALLIGLPRFREEARPALHPGLVLTVVALPTAYVVV